MNIKLKRVLSRIGLVFLAVIVIILGIRAVFNYTTGKKLQNYLENARAGGIPMSLKEIAPRCDDPDNAARLWKAAETLFVIPEGEDKGVATKALISRTIDDFFYGKPLKEDSRKSLADLIAASRRVFDLVAEASARPCFRLGDWTNPSLAVEYPTQLVKMIQVMRLLGIDAVFQVEAGATHAGLERCRQGMTFVRKTLDDPFLINNLVALANMKSLVVCLNAIIRNREIDSETLAAWKQEMDPESWRAIFSRCVQTERVLNLERGLRVISGDRKFLRETESEGDLLFYWLSRPLQKSQIIWRQNQLLDLEKRVDLPYFEMRWAGYLTRAEKRSRESVPWYSKISGWQIANFQSAFLKEATLEAMMLTTKAGLACKIYKKQRGHYPETLEALVPEFLEKVPVDPFTGKPLIYRQPADGGVLIYSVGSNRKDDGGRGTWQITQLIMDKDDDWAWSEK
jgi:hypothetical protein